MYNLLRTKTAQKTILWPPHKPEKPTLGSIPPGSIKPAVAKITVIRLKEHDPLGHVIYNTYHIVFRHFW